MSGTTVAPYRYSYPVACADATAQANLALALRLIEMSEQFAQIDAFAGLLDAAIQQEEYPNLLMQRGLRRDLATMGTGMQIGPKILRAQRYDVKNAFAVGPWVTVEYVWTGTLAISCPRWWRGWS